MRGKRGSARACARAHTHTHTNTYTHTHTHLESARVGLTVCHVRNRGLVQDVGVVLAIMHRGALGICRVTRNKKKVSAVLAIHMGALWICRVTRKKNVSVVLAKKKVSTQA